MKVFSDNNAIVHINSHKFWLHSQDHANQNSSTNRERAYEFHLYPKIDCQLILARSRFTLDTDLWAAQVALGGPTCIHILPTLNLLSMLKKKYEDKRGKGGSMGKNWREIAVEFIKIFAINVSKSNQYILKESKYST